LDITGIGIYNHQSHPVSNIANVECVRVCWSEQTKAHVLNPEVRDRIKYLSSNQFGVDEKKRPSVDEIPQASFRKLNIDW